LENYNYDLQVDVSLVSNIIDQCHTRFCKFNKLQIIIKNVENNMNENTIDMLLVDYLEI